MQTEVLLSNEMWCHLKICIANHVEETLTQFLTNFKGLSRIRMIDHWQ